MSSIQVESTGSSFEVRIVGLSTPREVTQATFRFAAAAQANLQTTQLDVPLSGTFTPWYESQESMQYGSTFLYVQPFTVQGESNAISSVTVTLSNSQGDSQPATASF